MKIGQVAKKYEISLDTIRYYISYGLLVPPWAGGQQDFDKQTLWDLELILSLKKLEFTLKEIHKILSLYRISNLSHQQDVEDLKKFYLAKKSKCMEQKEHLCHVIEELEQCILQINDKLPALKSQTGLPLRMLDLLCCPLCSGELNISAAIMNARYIFSGNMQCNCGYQAKIQDGILITPNKNTDIYDKPDIYRNMYKDLPPELITVYQRSYNWMLRQIDNLVLDNKVVMETYVNAWFFMHNHQQYLNPMG